MVAPRRLALPVALAVLALGASADDAVPARFVRIELEGDARVLSLAEVQVFRNGRNVALTAAASQSGTAHNGAAVRAVDASTNGVYTQGSVTHTPEMANPWWELDLGVAQLLDQITVWNRTDCCAERLEGFSVVLLDDGRREVWSRRGLPAPGPRLDLLPWGGEVVKPSIPLAERARLQVGINEAIDRGAAYLIQRQLRDGSWSEHTERHRSGQTALSLYALLKSGVPKGHPAVRRAIAWLEANPPRTTYSTGCALMAFAAYGDERHEDLVKDLVDALIDEQDAPGERNVMRKGMWAYPDSLADLSNTQYAVLGLRAAEMYGVDVPTRVWQRCINGVLEYQEEPHDVEREEPVTDGRTRAQKVAVAGFRYRVLGGHAAVTGSMTTAGIGTLAICRWGLTGEADTEGSGKAQKAMRLGVAWLAENFSVTKNPGKADQHLYYLYGLERVGGLLGIDRIGDWDWYWEGARYLVGRQEGAGNWGGEADTCFAVLFLAKATAATTGEQRTRGANAYAAERKDAPVWLRATGDERMTMWVSGFSEEARAAFSDPDAEIDGLRVHRVEYLVDGESIATLDVGGMKSWKHERFPHQHRFERNGAFELRARVVVVDPHAVEGDDPYGELWSDPLVLNVDEVLEGWMLDYAGSAGDELLRDVQVTVKASSKRSDGEAGNRAVDGRQSTLWVAAPDDARPTLTLDLGATRAGERAPPVAAAAPPALDKRVVRTRRARARLRQRRARAAGRRV